MFRFKSGCRRLYLRSIKDECNGLLNRFIRVRIPSEIFKGFSIMVSAAVFDTEDMCSNHMSPVWLKKIIYLKSREHMAGFLKKHRKTGDLEVS